MKFLVPPWAHQLEAIHTGKDRKELALFFEQGTGKTMTAINILRCWFLRNQRVLRTLILTPRIVVPNWEREFHTHSKVRKNNIVLLQKSGAQRLTRLKEQCYTGSKAAGRIVITNYESLNMQKLYEAIWDWRPEVLILDESHKCKDMKSKRTKKAIKLADLAKYKLLLTGTPMPNGPEDIFAQFRILDSGKTFGKNYFKWRANYFYDRNGGMPPQHHFPDFVLQPNMVRVLNGKINAVSRRVKKQECLDLPPLVRQRIDCELSPAQAKAYKEMKKEFITYVEDKACIAQLAITKGMRLQQILSGFIKVETDNGEGELKRFPKTPRLETLREILKEMTPHHKIIIWAVFRENYAMIREVCDEEKIPYVEVHGDIKDTEKDKAVDEFNTNSKCRVFIGHPGSGGIGINLIASDIAIFYSRNFSLEQDLQAEARNHRGGSEIHKKITRIDLVVPNTLDEHIMESLARKEKMSETILKDIARRL